MIVVEGAGVEPDPGRSTNRLMAHDFRRKILIPRRFPPSIESPGVPSCPLESTPVVEAFWRRTWFDSGRNVSTRGLIIRWPQVESRRARTNLLQSITCSDALEALQGDHRILCSIRPSCSLT